MPAQEGMFQLCCLPLRVCLPGKSGAEPNWQLAWVLGELGIAAEQSALLLQDQLGGMGKLERSKWSCQD